MRRSTWTITLAIIVLLVALPVFAADTNASKKVLGSDDGTSVVEIRVAASTHSIYGVTIEDESGSIKDIVAPKGWVGISSGKHVIFRTDTSPIQSGSSLTFRLLTTNEDGQLSISFRDKDSPVGGGKTL